MRYFAYHKYYTHYLIQFLAILYHVAYDAARAERERMIKEEQELCRRKLLEDLKLPVEHDPNKGASSRPVVVRFSCGKNVVYCVILFYTA